ILLLILGLVNFNIITSLLESSNVLLWQIFGLVLAGLLFVHAGFTWIVIKNKQQLNSWYGITSILAYTLFLIAYYSQADEVLPRDVPRWMVGGEFHAYVGTFLMPTLAHSLLVLMLRWTDPSQPRGALRSFLYALLIPGSLYLFAQIILPLWRGASWPGIERTLVIIVVFATIAFLFFLVRAIYQATSNRTAFLKKEKQLLWKIPITILFPILGLALNNGTVGDLTSVGEGIFGDFSAPYFYILAIINGILLCLPDPENKQYRLPLVLGRTVTFTFTLYFFFVFLPFLPLSVIAILVFGTGFLMLTPLALFVIHLDQLNRDTTFLRLHYGKQLLYPMLGVAFLLLPTILQVNYAQDRKNLHKALDYVYNPDYQKTYKVNKRELARTLQYLKKHKERGNDGFFLSKQIPYLGAYYNWMVLDNLTLSNKKIQLLDAIFFDAPYYNSSGRQVDSSSPFIELTQLEVESEYDEQAKAWRSWVHLELSNTGEMNIQEFNTVFQLPENTWISDYYLYVGDRKEMGILTEKRAATWIFNQIRNVNRDPGLLYYLDADRIGFRIFPFSGGEIRKTGIEFLHPEPVEFTFEDQVVQLGNPKRASSNFAHDTGVATYLSSGFKRTLSTNYRQPYFHFILDGSQGNDEQVSTYINQI
ncbi:MAG: MSEP-CTERM sorting domain-containing protein, partial [Bacteroidota bacterium]